MMSLEAWNTIVNKLEGNRIEFPTVPKTKKIPVWFSATTNGETIFINEAIDHKPSSKLSVQRKLKYSTFQKVYPLYLRRERGEQVSSEVTAITVNQVYYFSLIKHLCYRIDQGKSIKCKNSECQKLITEEMALAWEYKMCTYCRTPWNFFFLKNQMEELHVTQNNTRTC